MLKGHTRWNRDLANKVAKIESKRVLPIQRDQLNLTIRQLGT